MMSKHPARNDQLPVSARSGRKIRPLLLLAPLVLAGWALAQAPAWWQSTGVLSTNNVATNDFAPVNQGQLKWLASCAAAAFDGLGYYNSNINSLVTSFSATNNFLPVNLGQLKTVARPFYDVLWTNHFTNQYPAGAAQPYPWSSAVATNDYAMANIGQAKYLFSFDLSGISPNENPDSDSDGLPDAWELKYYGTRTGGSAGGDDNGDGVLNLTEYIRGRNPLAGTVPDTNGLLNLCVYTPLQ